MKRLAAEDILSPPSMNVTLTPDAPLPIEPHQFRGLFIWTQMEQDTGQPPAQTLHNDVMGKIALSVHVSEDGEYVTLKGHMHPYTHASQRVHVNGHGDAMTFQIICTNFNPMITKKVLFKRSFSPDEMTVLLEKDDTFIEFSGYAPEIAFGVTSGDASMQLMPGVHRKTRTVESISIRLTIDAYNAWVEYYKF